MRKKRKTIGILGGMGPEATADLYMKIARYYQENLGAKYDRDFPPIIIYSVPIPDVVESLENEKLTLKMLLDATRILEEDGCDFVVIACNTVQFLLKEIRKSVKIPILGIAEINAKFVKGKGYRKVGIIATKTTIEKGVYEKDFREIDVELLKPEKDDQDKITEVIMTQLAGRIARKDKQKLLKVIKDLKEQRAEAVLIACTDLPPLIRKEDVNIPVIDCTEVYAGEAARFSISLL